MLILLSLLSPFFILGGTAIECYSCYVKPPPRAPGSPMPDFDRLCSAFDQSDEYVVNCTQSTLCVTRTFTLEHRQESRVRSIMIVERGCAMQAYEHQALVRGKWRTIIDIMEEAYQTGCVTDREWAGSLASDTEYCYCDTDRYCQHVLFTMRYALLGLFQMQWENGACTGRPEWNPKCQAKQLRTPERLLSI